MGSHADSRPAPSPAPPVLGGVPAPAERLQSSPPGIVPGAREAWLVIVVAAGGHTASPARCPCRVLPLALLSRRGGPAPSPALLSCARTAGDAWWVGHWPLWSSDPGPFPNQPCTRITRELVQTQIPGPHSQSPVSESVLQESFALLSVAARVCCPGQPCVAPWKAVL